MKKYLLTLLMVCSSVISIFAQQQIVVHNGGNVMYESSTTNVDSIKFQNNYLIFNHPASSVNFPVISIDSITFEASAAAPDAIYIIYNNEDVTIINPYASQGIAITANDGHVTSTSVIALPDIEYNILGSSSDGSLALSSEQPVRLILSNLTLVNPAGSAFSITGEMISTIHLSPGTVNTLSDGSSSTANATLTAEDGILFTGSGTLNITGVKKHAVSTGTFIEIQNGKFIIPAAASDGFNTDEFVLENGTVTIQSDGDGIDAGETVVINGGNLTITSTANDVKAIKGKNGGITINGGVTDLTVSGNQSKGLSTSSDITINGGALSITASGTAVLEASGSGYDPSYCTGIKADGNILISEGTVHIECTSSNKGGKGISADGDITISGGTITVSTAGNGETYTNETGTPDAYTSCAIKSDLNISLLGGTITCTSTGTGGKGISADGTLTIGSANAANENLALSVTTTGNRIYVSGTGENADYANPKAVKSEGDLTVNSGVITISCTQSEEGGEGLESKATLTINGGEIDINTYDDCINASSHIAITGGRTHCKSRGNDGIDSNGTITVSGGLTMAKGTGNPEAGFDCDNNTFAVNGGIVLGTGGSTSNPTASASSSYSVKYTNATPETAICIKNSNGDAVLMFQLPEMTTTGGGPGGPGGSSGMTVLFSDPVLAPGTYTLHKGGTITGGTNFNGYYTGATYSGGTSSTFTISSKLTTIN